MEMIDPSIRAVFFDAVGTLLFPATPVTETYRTIARRHGLEIEESLVRSRLYESFEKQERLDQQAGWRTGEQRERDRWRSIVGETLREIPDADECFAELWEWYRSPDAWMTEPGAGRVLSALADRGLNLGIASNFDARLEPIVSALPHLVNLRDRCVISSLVGWRKPAAEFFREVVRQAGCEPGEVLFVGDDLRNDYQGASAAGLRAVLFDPRGRSNEKLNRIKTLNDLLTPVGQSHQ